MIDFWVNPASFWGAKLTHLKHYFTQRCIRGKGAKVFLATYFTSLLEKSFRQLPAYSISLKLFCEVDAAGV